MTDDDSDSKLCRQRRLAYIWCILGVNAVSHIGTSGVLGLRSKAQSTRVEGIRLSTRGVQELGLGWLGPSHI